MNSQKNVRIKSSMSLYQRKNRTNCKSLSLIDSNNKFQTYQKLNFNNQKLKTNTQQQKICLYQKSQQKMSLLMNSFQHPKIKSSNSKRYSPSGYKTEPLITQDISFQQQKHQQKQQNNQWVNSVLPTMSAQALHEQNQQLKKQCNFFKYFFCYISVRQQNSKLISKLFIEKRQKQKLAKQLSLENQYYNLYQRFDLFEGKQIENQKSSTKHKGKMNNQQLGFHPANYMITGIKYRYEKLKASYEQKCKQVEEIMKMINYTQTQQRVKQICVLEQQNKKLIEKIADLQAMNYHQQQSKQYQIVKIMNNNSLREFKIKNTIQQQYNSKDHQQLTTLIQAKNQTEIIDKINKQNAALKRKVQYLQEELIQKTSSIKTLHKSLTLLDNQLYYKKKSISKLKKIQKQIENKLLSLESNNTKTKKNCQQEIENVKKINELIFSKQKQIFMKEIEQKNEKIAKLEKQVSYLSTLLKYWKPLQKDQKSSIHPRSSSKMDNQQFDESGNLRTSLLLVSNRKRAKTKLSYHEKSMDDMKSILKEPIPSLKPSEFSALEINSNIDQGEINLRSPKTSRQKHSEKGFKARKINILQIEYMKEQLRYRCMAKRLTIEDIRQLFNFNLQDFEHLKRNQISWREKYITMNEIQSILINSPFMLTKQEALKLGRFIVEDNAAEHVFCDEDNQIQRDIAKSIIKAFIGDYDLPNVQSCKTELQSILKHYGVNLRRALEALCQNQVVSPKKLFELMESLGIEVSQQLRNQMICKLYQRSQNRNLNFLRYEIIFQPQFI